MRVLDHLLKAVRDAAVFNPEVQVAPACILWPDSDRQWESILPILQIELPELMILGDYHPEQRQGPAIWLRCVIGGQVSISDSLEGRPPILYLPGVSRQDLRAIESCSDHLKPLAELQYRGVIWSQVNAKDWTVLAYLKSDQGGLGLDVAQDNDTKTAMQLALPKLLDENEGMLKAKRLDRDYFNTLLMGGDPIRDLLQWLDNAELFQAGRSQPEWKAFNEVCQSQFNFNPAKDGVLAGAALLARHEKVWLPIWDRFCEAPRRYTQIPQWIKKCPLPHPDLFVDDCFFEGWPQWNEDQEQILRRDLLTLADIPTHEARKRILDLEPQHGNRRHGVWCALGEASLARALKYLVSMVEYTEIGLSAGTFDDLVNGYGQTGWRADDAVLRALAEVDSSPDVSAVSTAIRAIYLPWLENAARYLQHQVQEGNDYPGGHYLKPDTESFGSGHCLLFVDGLRFDVGKRLANVLTSWGLNIIETPVWSALPSVTATGKAATTPVRHHIRGEDQNIDFEPVVAATGQSLKGGYPLKKLLTEAGWQILDRQETGNSQGMGWCEWGNLDHEGHERGWKLAKSLEGLVHEIKDRIQGLLSAGWQSVTVVTDHGWLLMPEGLPKSQLPSVLTHTKWGRCASLKSGAVTDAPLYPWFWNPDSFFVLADGVSCFKQGEDYAHGGLSLQECLTLKLKVTRESQLPSSTAIDFTDIVWKGLRCTIAVEGDYSGLSLDIRLNAGDSDSSVIIGVKPIKENGSASVVVEDEDLEQHSVFIVLFDESGRLAAQTETVIGGGI